MSLARGFLAQCVGTESFETIGPVIELTTFALSPAISAAVQGWKIAGIGLQAV